MGTLRGVVIDEDEAIDAEVEFFGDGQDVFVFRFPVCLEARDMFNLEDGAGMLKAGSCDVVVILRTDCKEDAAIAERETVFLKCSVGFANWRLVTDLDLVGSIIADNAPPERVVEIENQDLAAFAVECFDDGIEGSGEFEVRLWPRRIL